VRGKKKIGGGKKRESVRGGENMLPGKEGGKRG